MKHTYTKSQMLAIWRTAAGLQFNHPDCSVESFNGIDIDAFLLPKITAWYLKILDSADPNLLDVVTLSDVLTVKPLNDFNIALISRPARCRRIVEVNSSAWLKPATPTPLIDVDHCLVRMTNKFSAPGPAAPLAACSLGGIIAAPYSQGDTLSVSAILDPADDTFTLDDSLLSTIPSFNTLFSHETR